MRRRSTAEKMNRPTTTKMKSLDGFMPCCCSWLVTTQILHEAQVQVLKLPPTNSKTEKLIVHKCNASNTDTRYRIKASGFRRGCCSQNVYYVVTPFRHLGRTWCSERVAAEYKIYPPPPLPSPNSNRHISAY